MGTVKYSGPVASFHCPTEATIRSLKVHFSPKQLGEGDPSPENVREIEGWDGVTVHNRGQNLIASDIDWLPDKWIIENGKLRHSVYSSFYIPAPKGIFYIHKKNTGLLSYGGLIDRPPEIGDTVYGSVTLSSYFNRTVDNEEGHPYLLICGPSNDPNKSLEEWLINNEIWIDLINPSSFVKPCPGLTTNYEFGVLGKNKFPAADGAESDCFLAANTPYVLSATSASEGYFRGYYEDGTNTGIIWINQTRDGDRRSTVITPEKNIIKGFFFVASGMSECQIELGSTATTYEPYDPNKTVYGGWVDLITGEVCEEYGFLTESSGGTLASIVDRNDGYYSIIFNFDTDKRPYSGNGSLCNILNYNSTLTPQNNEYAFYYYLNQQAWKAECRIYSATPLTTVDEAKTYLNQLGFKLAYKLPTSITYSLASTQLQTFLGHNNIWSNADYVEVEYDLYETQNILARKQFIMANQPHVVKSAAAPLQNFVTDVVAPLKECKAYFEPIQDLHGYDKPWVGGSGKNLFNPNCEMWDYSVYTKDGNNITQSGSDGRGWINTNFIPLHLAAGTYTISCSDGNNFSYATSLDEFATPTTLTNGGGTFTLSEDCDIKIKHSVKSGNSYPTTFTVQLEEGSTATTYEPYENICPISGWTGMEVYRTGKNLCDTATSSDVQNWSYSNSGYRKRIYGLPTEQTFTLQANITKDLGENPSNTRFYLNGKRYSGVFLNTGSPLGVHSTNNEPYDDGSIEMFHNGLGLTRYNAEFNNIQLELGDIATAYEPYTGTTIPITFPSEAGTIYGGYVDLITGEVVQEWEIVKIADLNWYNYSAKIHYYASLSSRERNTHIYTDTLTPRATGTFTQETVGELTYYGEDTTSTYKYIWTKVPEAMESTEANEWIKNTYADAIICYKLETPIHYSLSPTQLKTLRGTNNIWSNANGDIEVKYWTH